jgi:hypothetical protein
MLPYIGNHVVTDVRLTHGYTTMVTLVVTMTRLAHSYPTMATIAQRHHGYNMVTPPILPYCYYWSVTILLPSGLLPSCHVRYHPQLLYRNHIVTRMLPRVMQSDSGDKLITR